mgnify:CR=1 FL=1
MKRPRLPSRFVHHAVAEVPRGRSLPEAIKIGTMCAPCALMIPWVHPLGGVAFHPGAFPPGYTGNPFRPFKERCAYPK